jgi:hypothetical protein
LTLLPYPVVTVDMGQQLARMKNPAEIETLWLDYVSELAQEARADPRERRRRSSSESTPL